MLPCHLAALSPCAFPIIIIIIILVIITTSDCFHPPLSSQQRPRVVGNQNGPQLAQRQGPWRRECVKFGVQRGAVDNHAALPLHRGLHVLASSTRQDGAEGHGAVHPHPQSLTHHLPSRQGENPAPSQGEHSGQDRRGNLGEETGGSVIWAESSLGVEET